MGLCSEHGEQKIHVMRLNDNVSAFEFEVLLFSCGCFDGGKINGKVYTNPKEFLAALSEFHKEWRQNKRLFQRYGLADLEALADRKLGLVQSR